jgi:hypothetical protein
MQSSLNIYDNVKNCYYNTLRKYKYNTILLIGKSKINKCTTVMELLTNDPRVLFTDENSVLFGFFA